MRSTSNRTACAWWGVALWAGLAVAASACAAKAAPPLPKKIGFHQAVYDADGKLLPWTTWKHALALEMNWYLNCPLDSHGYPVFVFTTFMDEKYQPYRPDTIPCTQLGMGIISYLKYFKYEHRADPKILKWARLMGDYLVHETLTPDRGAYPRFTRSTGLGTEFPMTRGSQGDAKFGAGINVIEPDKGGLAAYGLVQLFDATGNQGYLKQAIQNADCLARNMRAGSTTRAPWPFRVDSVTGQSWGERNGNMVFILRLFDALIAKGHTRFQPPRDALWAWIRDVQIPAPDDRQRCHWIQFFEDQTVPDNRTSWAPLNTARYLIERRDALDPDWKRHAETCIQFALKHFSIRRPGGVTLMGEQDVDPREWGGACSTLGGVAALFYAAGGGAQYKEIARRNLNWVTYFIDSDGGSAALCGAKGWKKGSWQEDCHTDVLHNFMDAIAAVPEWAEADGQPVTRRHGSKATPKSSVDQPKTLCHHRPIYDRHGVLLPWTSWDDALAREMNWYLKCPVENGYPRFATMTFMDGNYRLYKDWKTFIPATQNGMGVISYLKYYRYQKKKDPRVLRWARYLGDYLVKEAVTPDRGKYPRFSRSTGWAGATPQPDDCGCQRDRPYEVEPDKGGIAGYALLLLFDATREQSYLDQALQNARVLAANMRAGDDRRSPWPFRVDYRTGVGRGEVAGNMAYILRLFDGLLRHGYQEFTAPRARLWAWILHHQLPNLDGDGMLWVQFFEDHAQPDNRTAWSTLNLARYLIEKRQRLDPEWRAHARALIEFTNRNFTTIRDGVVVCGEQDRDKNPWGGILSTWGAVLAMYSAATGSDEYKALAYQALNYGLYATDQDGCPSESTTHRRRGGWQEDAHTDKIHNYMDALVAFPEWAKTPRP